MDGGEERVPFLSYVVHLDLRFYQERKLGLDLHFSGWGGIATYSLGVAAVVVFLLAIFHVIPSRKHITLLFLLLSVSALAIGTTSSYLGYRDVPSAETFAGARLEPHETPQVRRVAGTLPVSGDQQAAIVALPLLAGLLVCGVCLAGTLYLSVFWGASLLPGAGAAASSARNPRDARVKRSQKKGRSRA